MLGKSRIRIKNRSLIRRRRIIRSHYHFPRLFRIQQAREIRLKEEAEMLKAKMLQAQPNSSLNQMKRSKQNASHISKQSARSSCCCFLSWRPSSKSNDV